MKGRVIKRGGNMEYRLNKRFAACKNIDIEYPGGKIVYGNIRDVSFGGIFVELCTTDLPPHALIQLRIAINDREHEAFIRVLAAITRRTHEGIGVLYCGSYGHIRKHVSTWAEGIENEWRSN